MGVSGSINISSLTGRNLRSLSAHQAAEPNDTVPVNPTVLATPTSKRPETNSRPYEAY
jgi:hypothetical protein